MKNSELPSNWDDMSWSEIGEWFMGDDEMGSFDLSFEKGIDEIDFSIGTDKTTEVRIKNGTGHSAGYGSFYLTPDQSRELYEALKKVHEE